ncbi:hypothetical protein [Flavobacterium sp.]|uniref:hypothetical protein n=1 Tax=Flavobacterium sp. TaxID=239 RepID=UPI0037525A7F
MRLKITLFNIIIFVFFSCSSLKNTKNNDVVKTTEGVKKENVVINQIAEDVKIEETVSQNSVPTLMVMLTQQQQLGKDLYENKCANCHNLYDTKTFSDEQWKPILLRMQLEANIEDIDRENIFTYVTMQ